MNVFDKPKLIDKSFLKKLVHKNLTKQKYINIELGDFIKQNILIILFIGLIIYILYYRYNLVQIKKDTPTDIDTQIIQQPFHQPIYTGKKIIDPQTRQQTRFIPENQQYSAPMLPRQENYDINKYNQEDIPYPQIKNNINPINLDYNFYEEKQDISKQKINKMDYSLKTRSASLLSPQYIGPNFSPAI